MGTRILTEQQKENIAEKSNALLPQYQGDQAIIFGNVVTVREIWIPHVDPGSKEESKRGKRPGFPLPKKARPSPSAGKVLMTVFWDYKVKLLMHFLEHEKMITGQSYANLLTALHNKV